MQNRLRNVTRAGVVTLALAAAVPMSAPAAADQINKVRLLGEQTIPFDLNYQGTVVGGLSSIDFRPGAGDFVMISDDRSDKNPARFYTARIPVSDKGLGAVELTGTQPFRQPDGTTYAPKSVDPEELRVDPQSGNFYWTQEGERTATVRQDPSVRVAKTDGAFVSELPIPANEKMLEDSGPRQNQALEAATFAANGTQFVTALEGPLLEDGPEATATQGATTRITVQEKGGKLLGQHAYQLEPIFATSPTGGFATTGVVSILELPSGNGMSTGSAAPGDKRFLVVERSFVTGVGNKVRIYEINLAGASNILDKPIAGAKPVHKKLVADLADFKLSTVDNIEGITWGPNLPSGERTLLLVSDNNFTSTQVTQVVALAVS